MLKRSTRAQDFDTEQSLQELSSHRVPSIQLGFSVGITTTTVTPITTYTVAQDEWRMLGTNGLITLPYRGIWLFSCNSIWGAGGGTTRYYDWYNVTSSSITSATRLPVISTNEYDHHMLVMYPANLILQYRVYQDSGGTLAIGGRITGVWLGSLAL